MFSFVSVFLVCNTGQQFPCTLPGWVWILGGGLRRLVFCNLMMPSLSLYLMEEIACQLFTFTALILIYLVSTSSLAEVLLQAHNPGLHRQQLRPCIFLKMHNLMVFSFVMFFFPIYK